MGPTEHEPQQSTQGPRQAEPPQPARATIDVRTVVMAVAVAAALLLAYFVGAGLGGATSQAADDTSSSVDSSEPPTMVMTGTGNAYGVPDEMSFHVAIDRQAPDLASALTRTNTTTTAILHRLRSEGVDPKDVKTTGLSIRTRYEYTSGGSPTIVGYTASSSVTVAVKDLSTTGPVLAATADAGGDDAQIGGIKMVVSDKDAMMQRARRDAVAEATAKAKQYAVATGRELGQVISVREVMPGAPIPAVPTAADFALRTDAFAPSAVPIRTGHAPGQVTVAVVWTFADS